MTVVASLCLPLNSPELISEHDYRKISHVIIGTCTCDSEGTFFLCWAKKIGRTKEYVNKRADENENIVAAAFNDYCRSASN